MKAAFSLANALELPIPKMVNDRYNRDLKENLTTECDIRSILDYTDTKNITATNDPLSSPENLFHLLVNPSPVISATTDIGIAALHYPEHRFSEQLIHDGFTTLQMDR